jgi:hypothetical protein
MTLSAPFFRVLVVSATKSTPNEEPTTSSNQPSVAMRLEPTESDLQGQWIFVDGKMVKDPVSERIDDLVKNYLTKLKVDTSGWNTLYQDPSDGRRWELTFPHSEIHGGGPPRLTVIATSQAREKYNLSQPEGGP